MFSITLTQANNSFISWLVILLILAFILIAIISYSYIKLLRRYEDFKNEAKEKELECEDKCTVANQKAASSDRAVISLSQEVLTPVNAIRTVIDIISKEDVSKEVLEYCDVLKYSANSLANTAENILGIQTTHLDLEEEKEPECAADVPKKLFIPSAKILVVDDNKVNLKVATALLKSFKPEITAIDNAYEAIDRIRNGEVYDLIFMDHLMPGMDGVEATKHIHKLQGDVYKTPIVALTANTGGDVEETFFKAGMCDFLGKPIVLSQMAAVLKKVIPIEKQIFSDSYETGSVKSGEVYRPENALSSYWNDESLYSALLSGFIEDTRENIEKIDTFEISEAKSFLLVLKRYAHSLNAFSLEEKTSALIASIGRTDNSLQPALTKPVLDEYEKVAQSIKIYLDSKLTES